MKKVLFFAESLDGGGAEGSLYNIVTNLDKDFFDITVYSETDGELRTEAFKKAAKYRSFIKKDVSRVGSILNRIKIKGSVSLPPCVVRRLYFHGKYDSEVAVCEGFSTRIISHSPTKAKKIAFVHTDFLNNPWSVSVYPGGEQEEKECYSRFDAIVCVSETVRDAFVAKYGFKEKTCVLHNIIDSERIKKMSCEDPGFDFPCRPSFLLAGNFLKVKGYDRFVEAAKRLRDENYGFSAAIIGHFYDEYPKIKKMIEGYNLDDTVSLFDYQSNPYSFMSKADAYVCSSYAEGFSTAVCEAVVCGLPVITTDCSGMREIFGNEEIGIICENSEDGLYNALKSVLVCPPMLDHYKKNSRLRGSYFNKENSSKRVNDFFKKILE